MRCRRVMHRDMHLVTLYNVQDVREFAGSSARDLASIKSDYRDLDHDTITGAARRNAAPGAAGPPAYFVTFATSALQP